MSDTAEKVKKPGFKFSQGCRPNSRRLSGLDKEYCRPKTQLQLLVLSVILGVIIALLDTVVYRMASTFLWDYRKGEIHMAEARWYVVHTYSGYENKVKANIEKSIQNLHLEDQILGRSEVPLAGCC